MFGDTGVLIATAVAILVAPIPFLAAVIAAVAQRRRDGAVGPRISSIVAFTGGLALGALLLFAMDLSLILTILGVPLAIVVQRWRARRRAQAGWLLSGLALPWTLLWGYFGARLAGGSATLAPAITPAALVVGVAVLATGVIVALRGDPAPPPPSATAPAGQPGSRALGSISAAIREPSRIGPFGQPELAMLVAVVGTLLVVPVLLPVGTSDVVRIGITSVLAAVIGTEAYVRGFPTRSRRAFEAFSWLGERELDRWRHAGGGRVPSTAAAAERWLASHRSDQLGEGARAEVLLTAGRTAEAREAVQRMPQGTPLERFARAGTFDLVDWRAGGDGDIAAMEHAAAEILPESGDDRLEAEVTIAMARVRRQMADGRAGAADAIEPFLEVRARLGRRADGQVGRALRPRLIPILLVSSIAASLIVQLSGSIEVLPF